jgi:soluble P-type ATPase
MIEIQIPGYKTLQLEHLVLDYNGTMAVDGMLISGVKETLVRLSEKIKIHVLTADTFGQVESEVNDIPCTLSILPVENQDRGKLDYIKNLNPDSTVCIGNGRNDRLMLKESVLGIALIQEEGAAVETVLSADVVCPDVISALDLLRNPLRLVATLRS